MQRYLNIRLPGSVITEVNITGITRLGGVQDAIKLKLGDAINSAAAFIGIFDVNNNRISTWTEFDSLPNDYFEEGGCCLTVHCAQNQPKFTPVVTSQRSAD
ncbi:hypothetical protein BCR33DRAFT_357008 [Rhizoclosmatium globosum]|uniref:Uncharacterized protein n=1 Tax=Rhizoclosmatium globosum TaxID=329046 RepID=A0A1Y2C1C8_9FUNG|nr:hypothetical protein BCR33DRAFT_357008 [Rhizoclosmatium globosum]|eukprot:ORY40704.1 hypothetical protein BCR33DRAFT_357008 [Rhizoclosmatium globosum]